MNLDGDLEEKLYLALNFWLESRLAEGTLREFEVLKSSSLTQGPLGTIKYNAKVFHLFFCLTSS